MPPRSKRVAIVASYAPSLLNFRGDLIAEIRRRGHEVLALAPDHDGASTAALARLGVVAASYPLQRTGLNPLFDLKSVRALKRIFERFEPDVVTGYTPKAAIYSSIAAGKVGVARIVPMLTGLGYAFQASGGLKVSAVRLATTWLYRLAFRASHAAIFHNHDDRQDLERLGLIPARVDRHVVGGSGVDLTAFGEAPLPPLSGGITFLMIARLVRYKGIAEYCEAAAAVRGRSGTARFRLIGPPEQGPAGFPLAEIERHAGTVEYLGPRSDIREQLAECHVYVLPSYREGMPRTVLEAMAVGRPIITTDTNGCRDTVDQPATGLLVPVGDAVKLAEAMEFFLKRPDLIPAMARASRRKVEQQFDVRLVTERTLAALGL